MQMHLPGTSRAYAARRMNRRIDVANSEGSSRDCSRQLMLVNHLRARPLFSCICIDEHYVPLSTQAQALFWF